MKPIDGMQTTPYGMPLMAGAWIDCLLWAAVNDDMARQFNERTGKSLDALRSKGIARMIDEATGYQRATFIAFADWFTEHVWGEEGKVPEDDQPEE
jgi:hypothetical protein